MRENYDKKTYLIILTMLIMLTGPFLSSAANAPIITKEELKAQLDNSDIMILDVRTGKDWKSSEFKIKGAVRANPRNFNEWAAAYPKDKKFVLYCA